MAVFNIQLKADPTDAGKGIDVVDKKINRLEKDTDQLAKTLRRAFGFISAGLIARELKNITDTYTNLQNRIRTVTDSSAELLAVTTELNAIASDTRSSFAGTVEVYARTALAVKELGVSQKQTLQFAESLNQAVLLSGASAQEAENALIQLSQGLASNTLRGDELRSVLEQLPVVADVISKSMGITRGELREMGTQGKITADIILKAFAEAREELSDRFAKAVPTIGQAFTVLNNNVINYVGAVDQANGISATFATTIIFLANNLDNVARSVLAVSTALLTILVARAIPAAIAGIRALTTVIAANPLGALLVGITAVSSALFAFSDRIKVSEDGIVSLADTAKATFEVISGIVGPLISKVGDGLVGAFDKLQAVVSGLGFTFDDVLNGIATFVNRSIGYFVGLFNATKTAFNGIRKIISDSFSGDLIENIASAFNSLGVFVQKVFTSIVNTVTAGLSFVGIQLEKFTALISDSFTLPEIEIPQSVLDLGKDVQAAFLEGFGADYVSKVKDAFTPVSDLIKKRSREIADARIADEQRVADETKKAFNSLDEAQERSAKKITGLRATLIKYFEKISDLSKNAGNAIVSSFNSAGDALADFITTGKLDFTSFANSIIRDIVRIATQQAIIIPLLKAFGIGGGLSLATTTAPTAAGNVAGNAIPLMENGGRVSKGSPYIVGEKRPELFIPDSSGRIIPEVPVSSKKEAPPVIVNINNETDANATVQQTTGPSGEDVISVTIANDIINNGPAFRALTAMTGITSKGR